MLSVYIIDVYAKSGVNISVITFQELFLVNLLNTIIDKNEQILLINKPDILYDGIIYVNIFINNGYIGKNAYNCGSVYPYLAILI